MAKPNIKGCGLPQKYEAAGKSSNNDAIEAASNWSHVASHQLKENLLALEK